MNNYKRAAKGWVSTTDLTTFSIDTERRAVLCPSRAVCSYGFQSSSLICDEYISLVRGCVLLSCFIIVPTAADGTREIRVTPTKDPIRPINNTFPSSLAYSKYRP